MDLRGAAERTQYTHVSSFYHHTLTPPGEPRQLFGKHLEAGDGRAVVSCRAAKATFRDVLYDV